MVDPGGSQAQDGNRTSSSISSAQRFNRFLDRMCLRAIHATDVMMFLLGPVLVFVASILIGFVTYAYFSSLLPILFVSFSLESFIVTLFGLWTLFNILFNYFYCVFTKPGTPPQATDYDQTSTVYLIAEQHRYNRTPDPRRGEGFSKWCRKCDAPKPDRAHHCHICKACVLTMDHHCPWMANCVGHFNYKYFFLFLFHLDIGCLFIALTALGPFIYRYRWQIPTQTFLQYYFNLNIALNKRIPEPPPLQIKPDNIASGQSTTGKSLHITRSTLNTINFAFILCVAIGIAISILLSWHIYLVLTAQTTIEFYANRQRANKLRSRGEVWRNPYDFGWRRNWQNIFGKGRFFFSWMLPSTKPPPGDGLKPIPLYAQTCIDQKQRPAEKKKLLENMDSESTSTENEDLRRRV